MTKLKITIMGSASSFGTPAAGGFWGDCDPAEPKNTRLRASILVQSATTNLIVDTSYDLRQQLTTHKVQKLDGVLISHAHSDHINGLDELRVISYHNNRLVDLYSNEETIFKMRQLWVHPFEDTFDGLYKAFTNPQVIEAGKPFTVGDLEILPFNQDHGTCTSLGFRFGKFAYSIDVLRLDEMALKMLEGIDVWVVDAGAYKKEAQTHATVEQVMTWIERIKPKMTYLTDLSTRMDYKTLCGELPPHVRPAYDGLVIDV